MPRSEWHTETWEEVMDALRDHFVPLGFEVAVNRSARTVTIIHRETHKALVVMDTTGAHFDYESRLILV